VPSHTVAVAVVSTDQIERELTRNAAPPMLNEMAARQGTLFVVGPRECTTMLRAGDPIDERGAIDLATRARQLACGGSALFHGSRYPAAIIPTTAAHWPPASRLSLITTHSRTRIGVAVTRWRSVSGGETSTWESI
jgi:hypothetical protein